jgi:peptide/nickel transport system permease protein
MSTAPIVVEAATSPAAVRPSRLVARLLERKLAIACVVYLAVIVAIAIVAPIVLPHVATENAGDLTAIRQGPSGAHLLGTDSLGRDVLERLLVGTRVTLVGVAEAVVISLVLGVPLGVLAGFFGGRLDRTVTWLVDLGLAVPGIIITLVVLAVFPQSMLAGMVTFGIIVAPSIIRIIRSATLPVAQELYIAAARVSGLSRSYIVMRHVLPRIAGPVIVQTSLLAAVALLVQAGLSFLHLIVAAPAPSWGGMVADGIEAIVLQPWLIWPPGVMLGLTILVFGLLGDAVSDATTESWSAGARPRRRGRPAAVSRARKAAIGIEPVPAPESLPAPEALLSVQRLTVAFEGAGEPVRVVEDVSFDIRAGETVGVVGESGCGKTMTAMAVLGLLPGSAAIAGGRVVFDGRDLAAASERELRRVRGKEIGLISQEPMVSLSPVFRVGWQLAEAVRRHRGVTKRQARAIAVELLQRVGLPDPEAVARRYPHELSGGMAQRVAIARALAGEPKLLIADEPTTALDVTVQAEILELLRELQRDRGMAILLVTHDWGVVADLCDRAVVMYAGQVVERADLVAIFKAPLHPYTEALLASNPHHATDAELLPTIPGVVPKPGDWPAGCHFHPRCDYATEACTSRRIPLEAPTAGRQTRCIHYDRLVATR